MVDLKKPSDGTELIRSELQALTATNQQLKGDLQAVTGDLREINSDMQQIYSANNKLNGELDLLTFRLERLNADTQDIRREVYEIKRTIERMQYELLRELNRGGRSDSRDFSSTLTIFAILFPIISVVFTILLLALAG